VEDGTRKFEEEGRAAKGEAIAATLEELNYY